MNIPVRDIRAADEGQTLAYMVIMVLVVMMVAAFAIDYGFVNFARTQQADALQQSLSKCLEPAAAMKAKNSDEPGKVMCAQLTDFLREAGYDGKVEAYYYEPTQAEAGLGQDKRVYVFGATLEADTNAMFGRIMGTQTVPTSVRAFTYAVPYAAIKVYKPSTPPSGKLIVEAGKASRTGRWTPVTSIAGMGDADVARDMSAEMSVAIERARVVGL